jgi:hypothetical protein
MRPDKKLMWRRLSCLTECLRKGVAGQEDNRRKTMVSTED